MAEARFLKLGRKIINQQSQADSDSNQTIDSQNKKISNRHKIAGFKSLQFEKENSNLTSNSNYLYDNSLSSKGQDYFVNSHRYSNNTDPRAPQLFNLDSNVRSKNTLPRIVPPQQQQHQQQMVYSPQPLYFQQGHIQPQKNNMDQRSVLSNIQPVFHAPRAQAVNSQYFSLHGPTGYSQPVNSGSTSQYYAFDRGFDVSNISSNINSQRASIVFSNNELNEQSQGWLYQPVTKSQLLSGRNPSYFNGGVRSQAINSLDLTDGRFISQRYEYPQLHAYYENQPRRNSRNSIEAHFGGARSLNTLDGGSRLEECDYLSFNSHRLKNKILEAQIRAEDRSKSHRLAMSDGKKSLQREASNSKNETSVIINHDYEDGLSEAPCEKSDLSIFEDSDTTCSPRAKRKKHKSKSKLQQDRKSSKRKATYKEINITKANKNSAKKPFSSRETLKNYLWAVVYGTLVLRDTHQRVNCRKTNVRKTILDTYTAFYLDAQKFFLDYAGSHIRAIYQEKKSMALSGIEKKGFFGSKALTQKEIDSRVQNLIMPKLRALLNALINNLAAETFPKSLSNFIATISENYCTPPDRFLSDFEIRRLGFTHFGTLKNMTELHSKMIIGMFLLVRIFIYQFLVCPWRELKDGTIQVSKEDPTTRNNLRNIASIFYHVVMDLFRGNVPVINNNQVFLTAELKIRAKIERLKTDEIAEENIKMQDEDVIQGLYTKKELASFFSEHAQDVNQLKGLVEELLKAIYKLTHKTYLETKISSKNELD